MRKTFFLFAVLLALSVYADARMTAVTVGAQTPAAGGGSCSETPFYSFLGDDVSLTNNDIKDATTTWYWGAELVITSESPICKAKWRLNCKDDPGCETNNYYTQIFTQSGADLGTSQGVSDEVAGNPAWAPSAIVEFTFSTPITLAAGSYWIVITHDGAASGTTESVVFGDEDGATGNDQLARWDNNGQNRTVPYAGDKPILQVHKIE